MFVCVGQIGHRKVTGFGPFNPPTCDQLPIGRGHSHCVESGSHVITVAVCDLFTYIYSTSAFVLRLLYNVHLGVWERIRCTFIYYAYAPWFLYFSFFFFSLLCLDLCGSLTGVGFIGQGSTCTLMWAVHECPYLDVVIQYYWVSYCYVVV